MFNTAGGSAWRPARLCFTESLSQWLKAKVFPQGYLHYNYIAKKGLSTSCLALICRCLGRGGENHLPSVLNYGISGLFCKGSAAIYFQFSVNFADLLAQAGPPPRRRPGI
jgi:hypothetical protein